MRSLVMCLLVGCGGGAARPPVPSESAPAASWPIPTGWKSETIPFPLGFAPTVATKGVEELRFAPRFFEPDAPTFWSYAFVWLLDEEPVIDGPWLERSLVAYFSGLGAAVGGEKYQFDPARWRVQLTAVLGPEGWQVWEGTYDGYEPFVTGQPLTLRLEARAGRCGARATVLVAASPKPADDPIWPELRALVAAFPCRSN